MKKIKISKKELLLQGKKIVFNDAREYKVFVSYVHGIFSILKRGNLTNILEIGGGHSTCLWAWLSEKIGLAVHCIDMNPNSLIKKIRNLGSTRCVLKKISFYKGFSVSPKKLKSFYEKGNIKIINQPLKKILNRAHFFIRTTLDKRKVPAVSQAVKINKFSKKNIIKKFKNLKKFPDSLINVYRTQNDEFSSRPRITKIREFLEPLLRSKKIDLVFLDSGEFSSMVEFQIVHKHLRPGGYLMLHDIFFPKSFKNWLVCSAILNSKKYKTIFVDKSTPQGLIIFQKNG